MPELRKLGTAAVIVMAAVPVLAGGKGVYGDVPDAKHAWAVHDWNRPDMAEEGQARVRE